MVGSGNFHVTNALVAAGARFVAAAHEGGAASMADAYARVSGRLGVLSVHQGPGVTNALTGITEAAKSRTPMRGPGARGDRSRPSNFFIDLAGAGRRGRRRGVAGYGPTTRPRTSRAACRAAAGRRGPSCLALPLDVQAGRAGRSAPPDAADPDVGRRRRRRDVGELVAALAAARRPVFIAGRGARDPVGRASRLAALADAVRRAARGRRPRPRGCSPANPWYLDVSGGFATPLAAELIGQADLVVGLGQHAEHVDHPARPAHRAGRRRGPGRPGPGRARAQPDRSTSESWVTWPRSPRACASALAAPRADATAGAHRSCGPADRGRGPLARRALRGRRRRATDIDPRTLTIALDDLLPAERTVVVDSGNFMGYPSMFLAVPDAAGFCFTQAFQSIGLGLASAIGAALARPDRLTVAALGDGGFLMSVAELTTAVRLGLPMLVVVLQRRGLRGRGAPLRAARAPAGHGPVPRHRPGRDRPRVRLRGRDRARRRPTWPGSNAWLAGARTAAGGGREGRLGSGLVVAGGGLPRALTPAVSLRSKGLRTLPPGLRGSGSPRTERTAAP